MPHDHNRDTADRDTANRADGEPIELTSEFAWVRVSLDTSGLGPRLKIEDRESDYVVYLDALELASMCRSTDTQRREWLRTGPYDG